jgi:hypothetical protein
VSPARKLGLKKGTSDEVGNVAYHRGDHERATRLSEHAHTITSEFRSTSGYGPANYALADASRAHGDLCHGGTLPEESSTE